MRRVPALMAAATFVVAALVRRDAALALMILGVLFVAWERLAPLHPQPVFRRGFATDMVHFVADELIAAPGVAIGLIVGLRFSDALVPIAVHEAVAAQADVTRWLEALALAELCGYWGHRLQHQSPFFWRFHKLHHSIPTLDWLAPNRRHPVDLMVARLSVALPLLALGFSVPVLAAHFVIRRFQGLFVHANLRVSLGPLRWFVASPEFHHWHHASDPAAYNTNFAGEVPLVDWLFGTLYLPRHQWPEAYGTGDDVPDGYLAQLAWPFKPADAELPAVLLRWRW